MSFAAQEGSEKYPLGIMHSARSARGAACAPEKLSVAEVEHWLLYEAGKEHELLLIYEAFIWRMVAAGLPIDRAGLYIGTLHPLLRGFAWLWQRSDGSCDELKVRQAIIGTESARRSPLWKIFSTGQPLRYCPQDIEAQAEFPIMAEFAAMGFTDYLGMLLGGGKFRHVFAYATTRPQRFTDEEIAQVERLMVLFALHVERHIAVRIADNTLRTYLGSLAAGKVLGGKIRRGGGVSVHAMIWVSDLRGFMALSNRLTDREIIQLINAYFEIFADAVLSRGGEVLKFVGDGLLAIFPFGDGIDVAAVAGAALDAAEQAQTRLGELNKCPPAALEEMSGWKPLRAGIALHEGDVFFGNIGSPERLDFTVVGPAVNEASRVEALNKTIGRGILITEKAARRIDRPLERLGEYSLRGMATPIVVYAPIERPGAAS
jgi:adenylate cyclase